MIRDRAIALLWRDRRWRWPRRILGAFGAVTLGLALAWHIAIRAVSFDLALLDKSAASSLTVSDASGSLLRQEATSAGTRERWMPLERISPYLVHATLDSEDHDFYAHGGVSWTAIARAAWLDITHRGAAFGGSTITMQLVRITDPHGTPRSAAGKVRQMVLAARLERALSKREILEHYLNRAYYGNGAWGAEQAARTYFGKSAAELSVGEATMLAVIPRGPTFYDPFRHVERVKTRRSHILGLMEKRGHLTAEERALADRLPLDLERLRPRFRAPHFVELVKERLPVNLAAGATVKTTLDGSLQRAVEVAVRTHVSEMSGENLTQAAVVVIRNSDGAILALVGSADYDGAQFNGVTARLRPGSTLKPFVYASAIERGDTPATIAEDIILDEDTYQFYAKDVKAHGFARYRESLAGSYNLSAVHTLQRVGISTVLGKLRTAGVGTLDRPDRSYDWGLAIGHAEVRLLDLTAAFTLFARGGIPVAPRAIERALPPGAPPAMAWSEPVIERPRIFSPEVTYLVYDILSDPDARKPMFGDSVPLNLPFPIALKTGTTKAYTDLWAIGVTREYTVGVWGGNFDGTPTHHVMSTQGATPLLRATYTAIAARFGDPTGVPRPSTVVTADICPVSGMRPGPHCPHRKHEVFITGHVPHATCDWHREVCGQPAIVYPPAIAAWARRTHRSSPPVCDGPAAGRAVAITYPANGARFQLEPFRAATLQRPPLAASPSAPDLTWTIDGEPAASWVPTPGEHRVVVASQGQRDEITIYYE